jgi:F-type H+-transporting ATPase subunit epsilon
LEILKLPSAMKTLILTPEQTLFDGEAHLVQLPGLNGSFEILDNHAPIIAALGQGKVRVVTKDGEEKHFEIKSGFVEAKQNKVNILVE